MSGFTTRKPRGKPFKKGQSGNPAGRPIGARSRVALLVEKLLETDVEEIVKAVVEAARNGDMAAAKICLDRLAPVRKGSPLQFTLPSIETAADVSTAFGAISKQMADGELTPEEAGAVAGVIELQRRGIETVQIDARLRALEEAHDKLSTNKA